jgi:hypothetical protein
MPMANTSMGARRPSRYPLVTETWVSQARPATASRAPVVIRRLGPSLGRDRAANWEERMIPAVTGRNERPARSGL